MRSKAKKLQLSRETVKALSSDQIQTADGAIVNPPPSRYASCGGVTCVTCSGCASCASRAVICCA